MSTRIEGGSSSSSSNISSAGPSTTRGDPKSTLEKIDQVRKEAFEELKNLKLNRENLLGSPELRQKLGEIRATLVSGVEELEGLTQDKDTIISKGLSLNLINTIDNLLNPREKWSEGAHAFIDTIEEGFEASNSNDASMERVLSILKKGYPTKEELTTLENDLETLQRNFEDVYTQKQFGITTLKLLIKMVSNGELKAPEKNE